MHERRRLRAAADPGGWVGVPLSARAKVALNLSLCLNMNKTFSSVGLDLRLVSCFSLLFSLFLFSFDWHSHFRVKAALMKQIMHFPCPASPSPPWPSQLGGWSLRGLRNQKVKHVLASVRNITECIVEWDCWELTWTRHHQGSNERSRGLHVAQACWACGGSHRLCFRWWEQCRWISNLTNLSTGKITRLLLSVSGRLGWSKRGTNFMLMFADVYSNTQRWIAS